MPCCARVDVAVGGLQQLEDDVLDVLADVAGLSERGGVDNGEGHVEHLGQRVREQRLAGAGGADEQDVGLGQLDFVVAHAVHLDALVVVVDRDGELLLGLVLADDVVVEEALHFLRLGQMAGRGGRMRLRRGRLRGSSCRRRRTRRRCKREDSRWATRSAWLRRPAICGRTSSAVLLRVPCAFSFTLPPESFESYMSLLIRTGR